MVEVAADWRSDARREFQINLGSNSSNLPRYLLCLENEPMLSERSENLTIRRNMNGFRGDSIKVDCSRPNGTP